MNDHQLLQYSRHILLDEIGIEGQQKICAARMLIIGAGGLASPAALYLAAAGIAQLTIVDDDLVELSNLQRQIMHTHARIGLAKVSSAQAAIRAINPAVEVIALHERADAERLLYLVEGIDVVLDCSDNYATRQAVNRACVAHGVPLVAGAALQFDGQIGVFAGHTDQPCYACAFAPDALPLEAQCASMGVFAPLTGVIGSLQAAEALKIVCGAGAPMYGKLMLLDARSMEWQTMKMKKNAVCAVCAK